VKATVLSGGVGGARFLTGLLAVIDPDNVVIVGNVADDIEILGLRVSPDLDSILYTLAGLADEERGWGRAEETWNALAAAEEFGGDAWFSLGDRDVGLHLVRSQRLREGATLSEVTAELAHAAGLRCTLLPATNGPLRTFVQTPAGTFPFQTWFVARGHRDEVEAVHYAGAPEARAAPGVVAAIEDADVVVIAPSNPHLSIGPILAIAEIHEALAGRHVPCIAVSPLIGGRAVKGPADRMLARLSGGTTPAHVAACYGGLIDALVIDEADGPAELPDGVRVVVTRTLMHDEHARRRLAHAVLDAAGALR
jgi:LPPG:FO 2-phospho-L-lactate transferase